jgi:hypothetical protein
VGSVGSLWVAGMGCAGNVGTGCSSVGCAGVGSAWNVGTSVGTGVSASVCTSGSVGSILSTVTGGSLVWKTVSVKVRVYSWISCIGSRGAVRSVRSLSMTSVSCAWNVSASGASGTSVSSSRTGMSASSTGGGSVFVGADVEGVLDLLDGGFSVFSHFE